MLVLGPVRRIISIQRSATRASNRTELPAVIPIAPCIYRSENKRAVSPCLFLLYRLIARNGSIARTLQYPATEESPRRRDAVKVGHRSVPVQWSVAGRRCGGKGDVQECNLDTLRVLLVHNR